MHWRIISNHKVSLSELAYVSLTYSWLHPSSFGRTSSIWYKCKLQAAEFQPIQSGMWGTATSSYKLQWLWWCLSSGVSSSTSCTSIAKASTSFLCQVRKWVGSGWSAGCWCSRSQTLPWTKWLAGGEAKRWTSTEREAQISGVSNVRQSNSKKWLSGAWDRFVLTSKLWQRKLRKTEWI